MAKKSASHSASEIAGMLPLHQAVFQILLALSDGDKHGYAILREVLRRSGGKIRLSAGTLYGNLARLERTGLIAESPHRPDFSLDDARRRYYQLTELGREVAAAEARRMQEELRQAYAKQLLRPGEAAGEA